MINSRKVAIIAGVASMSLLLSACSLYPTSNQTQTQTQNQASGAGQTQNQPAQGSQVVTFTDSGVNPAQVTVKSGQTVTWTNNSSKTVQVASNPHPTHTANRELSNGQSVLDLASGKSASVTLTKTGTWGFHDHLNPSTVGTVIVQ